MKKEYTIINGELYHYGVPGMKWGHHKKQLPAVKKPDPNKTEDGADIMPEGWKPGDSSKTSSSTSSSKTRGYSTGGPSVRRDQRYDEVAGEKGKTGPKTDNKTDNKTGNKTGDKTGDKTNGNNNNTNTNDKQNETDLSKEANAAKNTGSELKKAASEINNIKVNRPRMDLSDKTVTELRAEINREEAELRYNELFSQPSKMEKAKAKLSSFLQTAGTILALGGSALVIANEYNKLKKK